jgi:hypothetical protein
MIGRRRKLVQWQPLRCLEPHLYGRWRDAAVERGDQPIGGVAELADVQIIEIRVELGGAGHRGAAEHGYFSDSPGARSNVANLRALHVHAADHHDVGPGKVLAARPTDVLVDKAHRPHLGQIRGDQQQPLRRHESPHAAQQRIGMRKRAERRRVGRKNAQDTPLVGDV